MAARLSESAEPASRMAPFAAAVTNQPKWSDSTPS